MNTIYIYIVGIIFALIFGVIIIKVAKTFESTCPSGEVLNDKYNKCVPICENLKTYDPSTNKCVDCQDGLIYSNKDGKCIKVPTGYVPNPSKNMCELVNFDDTTTKCTGDGWLNTCPSTLDLCKEVLNEKMKPVLYTGFITEYKNKTNTNNANIKSLSYSNNAICSGKGTLNTDENGATCTCDQGYEGLNCSQKTLNCDVEIAAKKKRCSPNANNTIYKYNMYDCKDKYICETPGECSYDGAFGQYNNCAPGYKPYKVTGTKQKPVKGCICVKCEEGKHYFRGGCSNGGKVWLLNNGCKEIDSVVNGSEGAEHTGYYCYNKTDADGSIAKLKNETNSGKSKDWTIPIK